ncbi:MAG: family 20 glycosylhydrolase, partial [Bacteroidetes bacterium]|nr:family 20 glycosylhydrolase [Bacteroidota bacterium]
PSAEDRYTQYEGLEFLPKKELHLVIPAPRIEKFNNAYRPYLDALTIHFGSFQDPNNFLTNHLQDGVKTRIASTLDEDATIKIKENKTLESEAYLLQIDHTQITIEAHTSKAVFYALESLHQILLIAEREGKGIPILQIEDAPRFQNRGFKANMSNSSAFYFDMTDDRDFENGGFSWSGYVNYQDAWGTEPLNVFANQVKLESLGITEATVAKKEQLKPEARENFLGVQSQLWTETVNSEVWLDQLLMPNLLVFTQRAWSAEEPWLKEPTADLQKPKLLTAWNRFTNTLGQRQFPLLNQLYGGIQYDLSKPGVQIIQGKLHARQQFPRLEIHYSLNGKEPTAKDPQYKEAVVVPENSTVTLRVFDSQGRGGNSIQLN